MATKLYLRNTTVNGISGYYDMLITPGNAVDTGDVTTVASGTEIQWTKSEGGATMSWISGRVPAGGFTLTTGDVDLWASESNNNANSSVRCRIFKYNGTETELGGGPFNFVTELTTTMSSKTWVTNVTDTAFAENDRIVIKFYITNAGTMGGNRFCTFNFNAADGATGGSFFNLNETVAFKLEASQSNSGTFNSWFF